MKSGGDSITVSDDYAGVGGEDNSDVTDGTYITAPVSCWW